MRLRCDGIVSNHFTITAGVRIDIAQHFVKLQAKVECPGFFYPVYIFSVFSTSISIISFYIITTF